MRVLGLTLLVLALAPALAHADGRVIVGFESATGAGERREAREAAGVTVERQLPLPATQVVSGDRPAAEIVRDLEAQDGVRYAEPDRMLETHRTPDDPLLAQQWAWTVIDAPEAWDRTIGDPSVRVGVVDSGIDTDHPDLAAKLDTEADQDWVNNDNDADDDQGHGTHVAGTIGAASDNGTGVASVAWRTTLVGLKACAPAGANATCSNANIAAAFATATSKGLAVVNASLGGSSFSTTMRNAIAANPNVLYVVSAGNDAADNDTTPTYPCDYASTRQTSTQTIPALPNVICVAASTSADGLASFSNYGSRSVQLAAPGAGIVSTTKGGGTGSRSGTSMASPHVAGAAALIKAAEPADTVAEIRQALLDGAEVSGPFSGKTTAGGRLNLVRSLDAADLRPKVSSAPAISGTAEPGQTLTCSTGAWSGNPSGYTHTWLADGAERATGSTLALESADAGKTVACRVTATNGHGSRAVLTSSVTVATGTVTTPPTETTPTPPTTTPPTTTTPTTTTPAATTPATTTPSASTPSTPPSETASSSPTASTTPAPAVVPAVGPAVQPPTTASAKSRSAAAARATRAKKCKAAKAALKKARHAKTRRTMKSRIKKFC